MPNLKVFARKWLFIESLRIEVKSFESFTFARYCKEAVNNKFEVVIN